MRWFLLSLMAAACLETVYCACSIRSDFQDSGSVLGYINGKRGAENHLPVIWDADLADYAATLVDTCRWKHDKYPQYDCDGNQVGIVWRYMTGPDKNVNSFMYSLWDQSKVAYNFEVDDDGMGRSYAMLSNPQVTKIGCAIGDCHYGFCAVDYYTAYNL